MFSHMYLNVVFYLQNKPGVVQQRFCRSCLFLYSLFFFFTTFSNHVTVTRNDSHHFLNIYNILCILPHCVFKLLNFLKKVAVTNRLGFKCDGAVGNMGDPGK